MTRFHPQRRRLVLAGAATLLVGAAESTEPQWALVDEAIATLRSHAYYSARVDWDAASARTKRIRDEGGTPQDAIRFAVAQLRDGHSFYIASVSADRLQSNQAIDDFGIADAMRGRFGYLLVPNFVGNAEVRTAAFANDLRRRLARLEQGRPCGWIVDLRKNGGGNMLPMLSMLLVATALIADRSGKVYEGRIEPDEAMWSDGDAVIERASRWLATQCPEDRK